MDRERIVGSSPHWDKIKDIFRSLYIPVSKSSVVEEHESHGILVIVGNEGLFLQMSHTYEYSCILHGNYSGVKLYHYLSLLTEAERKTLLEDDPLDQWSKVHTFIRMPYKAYRRIKMLQLRLPELYALIPCARPPQLLTIPKGRSLAFESSVDTALRELREETGIILQHDQLQEPYIDRSVGTDGHIYITYIYPCFLDKYPQVILGKGFKGYLWLTANGDTLPERQCKTLQTFLHRSNERTAISVRCYNCSWLQSEGTHRYSAYPEEPPPICAHTGTDAPTTV